MFGTETVLAPGVTSDRCIEVDYSGNIDPQPIRLYAATTTGDLAPYLDLTIDIGDTGTGPFGDCGTFVPADRPVPRHPGRLRRRPRGWFTGLALGPGRGCRRADVPVHGVGPGRARGRGEVGRVRLLLGNPGRGVEPPRGAATTAVAGRGRRAGRRPDRRTHPEHDDGGVHRADGRHRQLGGRPRPTSAPLREPWPRCPIPPTPPCTTPGSTRARTSTGPPTSRSGSSRRRRAGPLADQVHAASHPQRLRGRLGGSEAAGVQRHGRWLRGRVPGRGGLEPRRRSNGAPTRELSPAAELPRRPPPAPP